MKREEAHLQGGQRLREIPRVHAHSTGYDPALRLRGSSNRVNVL